MPSLRNPVGPLPSSIYWRRRLVVLVVLAVALVLIVWLLLSGGSSGGKTHGVAGPTASSPAASITPGGSSDGSGVGGTAPGGSSGGADSGGGTGSASAPSGSGAPSAPAGTNGGTVVAGGGGTGGSGATTSGGSSGGGGNGSSGGSGGGSGDSATSPANSTGTMALPVCAAADVELALTTTQSTYDSSQWPTFRLAITNSTAAACRVDLGAKSAVLTLSSDGNDHVWSSGDCPRVTAAQWYAVPVAGTGPLTAQFVWSRTTSAPGCTPGGGGGGIGAGTYVARIGVHGVPVQPALTFKLAPIGS